MSGYTIVKGRGKRTITHPDKHGKVTVIGNGHLIDLEYGVPDWADNDDDAEEYFTYRGEKYWLSEFMRVQQSAPSWMHKYHGYRSDSFFSGILVKTGQGDWEDQIRAYTFY